MDWKFYKARLNDYEAKWRAGVLSDVAAARDVLALMADVLAEAADNEELAMDELADLTEAVIPLASLIERKGAN